MRALFIHPTFPGPFVAQVNGLHADPRTEVFFMAEHFDDDAPHPADWNRIRHLPFPSPPRVDSPDQTERELVTTFRRSTLAAGALHRLKREGFRPDVVCTSASSGCGLYIADIFPEARRIVHADWFHSLSALQRQSKTGTVEPWRVQNLWRFGVLSDAHCAFTSTEWQKVQFPQCIAETMHVLPQGVDTDWFAPAPPVPLELLVPDLPELKDAQELVTVSLHSLTGGTELQQRVQGLARLLVTRPECHVLVLGTVRDPFPGLSPGQCQSLFAPVLAQPRLAARLHTPGALSLADYRKLLRASNLHVYLTPACALSPELVEALSCGCLVLASDTEPVREVIRHGLNGFLFSTRPDQPDQSGKPGLHQPVPSTTGDAMAEGASILLNRSTRNDAALNSVRTAARATVLNRFNRARQSEAHRKLVLSVCSSS